MRDKHYNKYQFRLNEEIIQKLSKLKEKKRISWNLLFEMILKEYGDGNVQ